MKLPFCKVVARECLRVSGCVLGNHSWQPKASAACLPFDCPFGYYAQGMAQGGRRQARRWQKQRCSRRW